MAEWFYHAAGAGRRFTILYLPRSSQLVKPAGMRDSWKPWIEAISDGYGIELVDPTETMVGMMARGEEIFHDHLARAGHEAVAGSFIDLYRAHPAEECPGQVPAGRHR